MSNKSSKWYFFLDNSKVTFIVVALAIVLGLISIISMPKESSPEIDFPFATITTVMPGASALEMEELVTDEIESQIGSLEKLDEFTSVSRPGVSVVSVLFDIDEDGDEMVSNLRNKLSGIERELPSDAESPVISKISLVDVPLLVMAMSGAYTPEELRSYAEDLEDELKNISYVSRVEIVGAPSEEVLIELNPRSLSQYNLSIGGVIASIRNAHVTLPVGSVETSGGIYAIRIEGKIKNTDELANLPIASAGVTPIFLKDIANIRTVYDNGGQISRLSVSGEEYQSAVSLYLYKSSGGNILDVVEESKKVIENSDLPDDVLVVEIENMAEYVKTDLFNLLYGGIATMIIVFLLLYLFVGKREAIIASLGVPLTFLITFIFLNGFEYTINFLTLFSLILALGILVDSSIVVTEGIYQNLKLGSTPEEAAKKTILEFSTPLISGTLTTVFVFLPMLFMSGIMGKFIESIPVTVSTVLFASLFVALGVLPALAIKFLKNYSVGEVEKKRNIIDDYYKKLRIKYNRRLHSLLESRKKQNKFLASLVIGLIIAIILPISGLVAVNMFPSEGLPTFYIDIENPVGTTLKETMNDAFLVEQILKNDSNIETVSVKIGEGVNSLNKASFIIALDEEADKSSIELTEQYNESLGELLKRSEVSVYQTQSGPTSEAPVQVTLVGDSLVSLDEASDIYLNILRDIPGTQNVRTGSPVSNGEFSINILRSEASSLGVDPASISSVLRTAITGSEVITIKDDNNDIDVRVTLDLGLDNREVLTVPETSLETLKSIELNTNRGTRVPLSSVVSISLTPNRASINHEDGKRIIKVMSDVKEGFTAGGILSEFNERREDISLPQGVSVEFGGEAEDIAESFTDLGQAMILGIFMIFALLVWQFSSYRQPLFILMSIPLSLIGVFFGLLLVRQPLSFPGFIGVVALAGIVVNNAIILMDRINLNRQEGLTKKEAIERGAMSRLQPIFLTTITTVLGILPLALTNPVWGPLGYSIVFGLSFSSLLTLFLIPILYERFEK